FRRKARAATSRLRFRDCGRAFARARDVVSLLAQSKELGMKKLLVVTAFAATVAYPAVACDWNREASAQDQVVATATDQTPQATPACPGTDGTAPQPASVASEETTPKPVFEPAPMVLAADRR